MNRGTDAGPENVSVDSRSDGGAAEALVLVNSLATTAQMWDAVVENLPADLSVIRFDQRDRGSHGGRPFTLDDLVDDLFDVLDGVDIKRAHVAGVSLGGLVALRAAQLRPGRVSSVTAMCCAARFKREVWLERGRSVRQSGIEPLIEPVMNRWFTQEFQRTQPQVVAQYRRMFASTDVDGYAYACDLLAEADIRADLPSIQAPTLILSGDADHANPVPDQALVARAVPGARHDVLRATAHLAPSSAPDQVAGMIANHIGDRR